MATEGYGLLPSSKLQPYGEKILQYGIGQLGTPINVGQLTPKVAGPTALARMIGVSQKILGSQKA